MIRNFLKNVICLTLAGLAITSCKPAEDKAEARLISATVKEVYTIKGHPIMDAKSDILYTSTDDYDVVAYNPRTGDILRKSHELKYGERDENNEYLSPRTTPLTKGNQLKITPDGTLIAALRFVDHDIDIYDAKTLKKIKTIDVPEKGDDDEPTSFTQVFALHPLGTHLLTVNAEKDGDTRYARLWDIEKGAVIKTFTHEGFFEEAVFSPDGRTLALTHLSDKPAFIYRLDTGEEIELQGGHEVWSTSKLKYSPDSQSIFGFAANDYLEWNVNTGNPIRTLYSLKDTPGQAFSTGSLPSADGIIAHIKLENNQEIIYIRHTGQEPRALNLDGFSTFESEDTIVNLVYGGSRNIGMSPDQRLVWIMFGTGSLSLWDTATGAFVGDAPYSTAAINFTADGKFALLGGGNDNATIRIVDVDALLGK